MKLLEAAPDNLLTNGSQNTHSCRAVAWGLLLLAIVISRAAVAEESQSAPAAPTEKASEHASAEDVKKWIEQLGDDVFSVRQAAAARLLQSGTSAREPLALVADGPDPESRAAARRLVALIDRTEFNRRLEAFAADVDGKRGLTLPGWDQFRELVGGDALSRALFVDMQRAEGALIAAAFGVSSQPPEKLWEERIARLVTWQFASGNRSAVPPLGNCAAMIFLGSVPDIEVSDRGANMVENLIQRPPISEALAGGAPHDAVRRLVVAWILNCPNKNEVTVASRLQLMSSINLKGGLPLALAVAGGEQEYGGFNALTRAWAMLVVGQFGGPEHAEKLEPLLNDTRVCMPLQVPQPNQPAASVQLRDVALCVMLQLTGQKPADYGYFQARLPPQQVFDIRTLHAANDQARLDAAAKWKAWRESNEGREAMERRDAKREGREPEAGEK